MTYLLNQLADSQTSLSKSQVSKNIKTLQITVDSCYGCLNLNLPSGSPSVLHLKEQNYKVKYSRILHTVIVLYASVFLTSFVLAAEIYKWEDANGIHISDNPSSIPEKYREKILSGHNVPTKSTTPQVNVVVPPPTIPIATIQNQAAVYQANLDQQRRAAEEMRQQQARALAVSTNNAEGAFQSLARFMAIWLMVGFFLFIAWVSTIVDIVRSEFDSPSNKTVWMLLVLFLPLLGMLLYYLFGLSQKCSSTSYADKHRDESPDRLNRRDPKDRDFVI